MEPIPISDARARLLELAGHVAARPGEAVLIENRRQGDRVALVAESYLRTLEATVAEMQKKPAEEFELVGSIETDLSPGELAGAITALRKAQDAADMVRLADIAE